MYKFRTGIVIMALIIASSAVFASAAFAKNDSTTRPGWGYGDKNHIHTGPPGQSVVVPPFQHRNGQ